MKCIICYENENPLISLHDSYEHYVHQSCLDEYFKIITKKSLKCPLCSQPMSEAALSCFIKHISLERAIELGSLKYFQDRITQIFENEDFIQYNGRQHLQYFDQEAKARYFKLEDELQDGFDYIIENHQEDFLKAFVNKLVDYEIRFELAGFFLDKMFIGDIVSARILLEQVMQHPNQCMIDPDNDLFLYYKTCVYYDAEELVSLLQPIAFNSAFHTNLIKELNKRLEDCSPEADHFVKMLSRHLSHVTKQDLNDLLNVAAERAKMDECRYLIELGGSIDFENTSSLLLRGAIEIEDWESLNFLVNSGVDPRTDENFAVSYALMRENWDMVSWLSERGALVDSVGFTNCLYYATATNDFDGAKTLLDNGASPCNKCLQKALQRGHVDIANLLIERGADVDNVSRSLIRPLDKLRTLYNTRIRSNLDEKFLSEACAFPYRRLKFLLFFALELRSIPEFASFFEPLLQLVYGLIYHVKSDKKDQELIEKVLVAVLYKEPSMWPQILQNTVNAFKDEEYQSQVQRLLRCSQHTYREASMMINLYREDASFDDDLE